MATAQRVLWETITVFAFVALLITVWVLSGMRSEAKIRRAESETRTSVESLENDQRAELEALRRTCQEWGEAQARQEAEAVFRNFSAGIRRAAESRWGGYLDTAKSELLRQPRIVFAHLISPTGRVLFTSDKDYAAKGRADQRADWALAASSIQSRLAGEPGVLEVAGPLGPKEQSVAQLWLGYDIESAIESSRPTELAP